MDVAYCGFCGTDLHIFHGAMDARVKPPQTLGHEASGVIAEVGEGVSGFAPGDRVVVRPLDDRAAEASDRGYNHICRRLKFIGIDSPGAFQQSWSVPSFTLHQIPPQVDLKLAALTEPLAVACHDVRRAGLKSGELSVVIGGGPIGMFVALVARAKGARVLLLEVNEKRLAFARQLGFEALHPGECSVAEHCRELSDGAGADVVFEVSGAPAAARSMTDALALRGRVVLVAIYPQPVEINLFDFFWKELTLIGARVYEPTDYEESLQLMASGSLPLTEMITAVRPLSDIQKAFELADGAPDGMKTLIDCQS